MKFYMLWVKEPWLTFDMEIRPFGVTHALNELILRGWDDGCIAQYIFFDKEECRQHYAVIDSLRNSNYFIMEFEA